MLLQPRQVHFRTILEVARNRSTLVTIGSIFFLVGIGIFIVFSIVFNAMTKENPIVDYDKVKSEGKLSDGVIVGIETDYHTTVNNRHPLVIRYRYPLGDVSEESKMQTLSDVANTMKAGDTVKIRHVDRSSMIDGLDPFQFPFQIFYILPGVFMLLGLPMVILMFFQIRNELWILKYGKVTDAEVLSTVYRKPSRKSRSGEGLIIAYRYTGDSGKSYLNESFTRDLSLLQTIKQGDMIKIFVSHMDESKSILVNKLESVRNNWNVN